MPDPDATPQGSMFSVTVSGSHVVNGNTVVMKLYRYSALQAVVFVAQRSFTLTSVSNNSQTLTWSAGFSAADADGRHLIFRDSVSIDDNGAQDCYMETIITDGSNETSVASFFGYSFANFAQDSSTGLSPNLDFASATTTGLALMTHRTLSIDDDTNTALDLASSTPHTANWGDVFDITLSNQDNDGGSQNLIDYYIESGGTKTYLEFSFNQTVWGQDLPGSGVQVGFIRLPASGTNGTYSFGYRVKHADSTAEVSRNYTLQFSIS
jgi:hypothetical protein